MNIDLNHMNKNEKKILYIQNMRPMLNKEALFCDENSEYRLPPEPDKNSEVKIRFRTAVGNVDRVYLCVGDEEHLMEHIENDMLFDYYEYVFKVFHCYNGEELINFNIEYDVLMLDIDMPDKDGIEAARTLLKNGYNPQIIMLSSKRERFKDAFKIGAKRCLVKKKKLLQITENLNNQMMIMDDQLIALDNAVNIGAIMTTIKNANNALKNNQASVEELQDEGEKIKEHKDNIGELNQVIEDYNNENDDEDDLADELEKCANELKEEAKLPSANKEDLNDKGKIKNLDDELNLMSL